MPRNKTCMGVRRRAHGPTDTPGKLQRNDGWMVDGRQEVSSMRLKLSTLIVN